ncbi:ATP-binding protein [Streptomyces sp. NPDC058045]|uniref:ATP-binding protein n=1 Tax=Streptomyces sp. NPDC058045 TaxID=3346311 RepID=UPI0036ED0D65
MGTNGSAMLVEPSRRGLPPIDPSAVSRSASCALSARYEAVREARKFSGGTLDEWGLADHCDDIGLVVSELVTNALRHALPSDVPRPAAPPVRLHLLHWASRLVCAVRDPSTDSPIACEVDDFAAESGRGLFLVDSLSQSWGWHPLPNSQPGKVVWAVFGV